MASSSYISISQITALALFLDPTCSADATSLQCRLLGLLHLLYVLGATLAVILAIVVVFAVRSWRAGRNTREIPPPKPEKTPRA